jgi:sigma-B regulation protein RsbU (phosphoserine phosphatase)
MVSSRQPRTLDGNEMRLLSLLANQAAMAIEKARLHQEEVKGQVLERELAVAKQIQLSLLPQATPIVAGWEFAAFYRPARSVGGDFYDFFTLPGDPGSLGLVIADVAGKGMPAALFMALGRTTVRTAALGGRSPSAALERANEWILNDSWTELFLTAFYAALDIRSGRLVYARAGHNPPLLLRAASGEPEELTARGVALGMFGGITLKEREIGIMPGDLLLLYTDGVTEAMDASGQPFGEERLRTLLAAQAGVGAQEALEAVVEAVEACTSGVPLSDDMTLLVVKRSVAGG